MSAVIKKRNKGLDDGVQKIAWKAQQRLHGRYTRLMEKGKTKQKTVVAVAREMTGFIWAIARQVEQVAQNKN